MSTNRTLTWQELACAGDCPEGRVGESLTTSNDQTQIYLCGGMVEDRGGKADIYLNDFFAFDPIAANWRRKTLTLAPEHAAAQGAEQQPSSGEFSCRAFHSTVTYGGKLFVFGGCNSHDITNTIEAIEPEKGEFFPVAVRSAPDLAPAPRYCHSAVVFEDAMYVFGGKSGGRRSNSRLSDVHRFDFATNSWSIVDQHGDAPPSRSAHSAVVCGRKMYVFGGRLADGSCSGEMFEFCFDSSGWRRIKTAADGAFDRARHSAVLHNGVIAVFGGWNGKKKLNDLYLHALDGSEPEAVPDDEATVPARRDCHVAVMWRNTMLVFSGRHSVRPLTDVQALRLGPPSLVEICRDWLYACGVDFDRSQLPDRLSARLRTWEEIQHSRPHTPLQRAGSAEVI